MKAAAEEITVLRSDPSVSAGRAADGPREADPPRVLKQRFVLDQKLGSGGMGTVFRAKDLRKVEARDRHPYVAVKVLNNDFREHPEAFIALQREAAKSQGLSHRNIVSIYDFDKDGDVPFIIMELLEGLELADTLRAYPTGLPDEMAWTIIRCLCDGLEHAHEAGVVHADFKPGNVLVAADHKAKILDFGIARAVQVNPDQDEDPAFDPARLAALTPAYASAEMLDGSEAEVRDDVFSLGVVIYLILTGQHPYQRTPANDACRLAMRPERTRRLTRRQWRMLERCLAFHRAERPASVSEIKKYLFQPSPWRSRTALVAVCAVLVTIAVGHFKEDAAVNEAKVEVRQNTLVDAQVARLSALIEAPQSDSAWEANVAEEIRILRGLLPPGAAEPAVLQQIRQRYLQSIVEAGDPDAAMGLYRRGLEFGPMPEAEAQLAIRLTGDVVDLLDRPRLDAAWMAALKQALDRVEALFPGSARLAALRLETVDVLEAELDAGLGGDRSATAPLALEFLATYGFDADTLEALQSRVQLVRQNDRVREVARQRQADTKSFRAELADALNGSCLRFDPAAAAAVLERWVATYPAFDALGRQQIGMRLARCVAQLEALDRDRALQLKRRSETLFGPMPGLESLREDPCGAAYLVGSGSQNGRRGSCADRIGESGQGPRLVVVPGSVEGSRFAITRQEVSWSELKEFCGSGGRCPAAGQDDLPVAGVALALAQEYARWLSEQTGFSYRLPTYQEWLQAARGTSDPNRNCEVQLGGVHRGLAPVAADTGTPNDFGLVNVLGNVQEWVVDDGAVKAAGGAFSDPVADCVVSTLRIQGGGSDSATGFRLVREVT